MNQKDMFEKLQKAVIYWVYDRALQEKYDPDFKLFNELTATGLVDIVQYRSKNDSLQSYIDWCRKLNEELQENRPLIFANDFCEAVIPAQLDGVHIGQSDMPLSEAREFLGNKIIGATARSKDVAETAAQTADYLGAGTVFHTSTKRGLEPCGPDYIEKICSLVNVPVFPIGGIYSQNARLLAERGIGRVAIASSLLKASDPLLELRELRQVLSSQQGGV